MIAAILPRIAADLTVSLQAAGQLVTVFALTYGLSSPVLTALTGGIDRRLTLLVAMAAFVGTNLLAAAATGYWSLLVSAHSDRHRGRDLCARTPAPLLRLSCPPERRGRALAVVTGGVSLAVALGVPVGALVGTHLGWRTTFLGVAALAAAALAGLLFGLPRDAAIGLTTATLKDRMAVVAQPAALRTLLVTTLWAMGSYTVYTYIAPYLAAGDRHRGRPDRSRAVSVGRCCIRGATDQWLPHRPDRRAACHAHGPADDGAGAAQPVGISALARPE